MKIEITKVTDWERVVDAARFTQRKNRWVRSLAMSSRNR